MSRTTRAGQIKSWDSGQGRDYAYSREPPGVGESGAPSGTVWIALLSEIYTDEGRKSELLD